VKLGRSILLFPIMNDLTQTIYLSAVDTHEYADDDSSPSRSVDGNGLNIAADLRNSFSSHNAYVPPVVDSILENRANNGINSGINSGINNEPIRTNNPFGGSFHSDNIQNTGVSGVPNNMFGEEAHEMSSDTSATDTFDNVALDNGEIIDIDQRIENGKDKIKNLANSLLSSFTTHGAMRPTTGPQSHQQHPQQHPQQQHQQHQPNTRAYPPPAPSELPYGSAYDYFVSPESSYYEPESNTYYQHTNATLAHENLAIHLNKYIKWYMISLVILFAVQVFNAITTPNVGAKIFSVLCAVFAFLGVGYLEKIRRRWLDY